MPDGLTRPSKGRVLLTTDAVGGVWRYTLDLAAGFAGDGVQCVVAVLGPAPDATQLAEAAEAGLELIETGLALDWTAETAAELERAAGVLCGLAQEMRVCSAHLHAPALVGRERWPLPAIAVAHSCVATWWRAVRGGPLPDDFAWRTAATRAGLRAAAAVIAPSRAHAGAVREVYGPVDVRIVHNGSDAEAALGFVRERAVLTAGRLWDEGKGATALDHVAGQVGVPVRAAGPVRGPNGAMAELTHMELLGTLDATGMARAYAEASVFASMAKYEPFGLSVLEAARAGMRLVLSDIPSFRELWDGAALFVRDEADLLPALLAALEAEGDGGAEARAARYSVAAMVERTLDIHRSVGALV